MHIKPILLANIQRVENFEKILHAGLKGVHPLFSSQAIREAFESSNGHVESNPEFLERFKAAIAGLLGCQDLTSAHDLVKGLDPDVRNALVLMYFDFLEQYRLSLRQKETVH